AQGGVEDDELVGHESFSKIERLRSRERKMVEQNKKARCGCKRAFEGKSCARYCLRPFGVASSRASDLFIGDANVAQEIGNAQRKFRHACPPQSWCSPRSSGSSVEVLTMLT
ncbi:MAG: hypothetical protein KA804_03090, partial [Ottowia sp.]|nr:hypothetical protein [Ottowia sp.]HRM53392.1 hypothetical protein [Ottowia sp.]